MEGTFLLSVGGFMFVAYQIYQNMGNYETLTKWTGEGKKQKQKVVGNTLYQILRTDPQKKKVPLTDMENYLSSIMIEQELAVKSVCHQLLRYATIWGDASVQKESWRYPLIYLFVGPKSVGKIYMAKHLAISQNRHFIYFDMTKINNFKKLEQFLTLDYNDLSQVIAYHEFNGSKRKHHPSYTQSYHVGDKRSSTTHDTKNADSKKNKNDMITKVGFYGQLNKVLKDNPNAVIVLNNIQHSYPGTIRALQELFENNGKFTKKMKVKKIVSRPRDGNNDTQSKSYSSKDKKQKIQRRDGSTKIDVTQTKSETSKNVSQTTNHANELSEKIPMEEKDEVIEVEEEVVIIDASKAIFVLTCDVPHEMISTVIKMQSHKSVAEEIKEVERNSQHVDSNNKAKDWVHSSDLNNAKKTHRGTGIQDTTQFRQKGFQGNNIDGDGFMTTFESFLKRHTTIDSLDRVTELRNHLTPLLTQYFLHLQEKRDKEGVNSNENEREEREDGKKDPKIDLSAILFPFFARINCIVPFFPFSNQKILQLIVKYLNNYTKIAKESDRNINLTYGTDVIIWLMKRFENVKQNSDQILLLDSYPDVPYIGNNGAMSGDHSKNAPSFSSARSEDSIEPKVINVKDLIENHIGTQLALIDDIIECNDRVHLMVGAHNKIIIRIQNDKRNKLKTFDIGSKM